MDRADSGDGTVANREGVVGVVAEFDQVGAHQRIDSAAGGAVQPVVQVEQNGRARGQIEHQVLGAESAVGGPADQRAGPESGPHLLEGVNERGDAGAQCGRKRCGGEDPPARSGRLEAPLLRQGTGLEFRMRFVNDRVRDWK